MKVGTKILDYIYEYVKKLDCVFVVLLAEKDNIVAQQFYESVNYKKEVEDYKDYLDWIGEETRKV